MFRFLGLMVMLLSVFGFGYYFGQHKVQDFRKNVMSWSRQALDSAFGLGIEHQLRMRGDLVEAKSRVVQAKSELMDRNFGKAARELGAALDSLQAASHGGPNGERVAATRALAAKVRATKGEITRGKVVSRARLDAIQRELDFLLEPPTRE